MPCNLQLFLFCRTRCDVIDIGQCKAHQLYFLAARPFFTQAP